MEQAFEAVDIPQIYIGIERQRIRCYCDTNPLGCCDSGVPHPTVQVSSLGIRVTTRALKDRPRHEVSAEKELPQVTASALDSAHNSYIR